MRKNKVDPFPRGKEERDDVRKTVGKPRQWQEAVEVIDTSEEDLTQQLPIKLRVQPA